MKPISLSLFCLVLSVYTIKAQSILAGQIGNDIVNHDIVPDVTIYGLHNQSPGYYPIDLNGDNIVDFALKSCDCSGQMGGYPNSSITAYNNNEVSISYLDSCWGWPPDSLYAAFAMAKPYSLNETIINTGLWTNSIGWLSYRRFGPIGDSLNHSVYCGDSTFRTPSKYIGVRMLVSNDTIYGWIKVRSVSTDALTVEEFGSEIAVVGINKSVLHSAFNLYPNPTNSSFKIDITSPSKKDIKLMISDILGNQLLVTKVNNGINEIDIRHLANGIYYIKTDAEEYIEVQQIIKFD